MNSRGANGAPIALRRGSLQLAKSANNRRLDLEPQGQIIWQGLGLDQTSDTFADVRFSGASGAMGRIGVRLHNRIALENG